MSSNTVSEGDSDRTKTDAVSRKIAAKKMPGNQPRKADRIKCGRETWAAKKPTFSSESIVSVAFTVSAVG